MSSIKLVFFFLCRAFAALSETRWSFRSGASLSIISIVKFAGEISTDSRSGCRIYCHDRPFFPGGRHIQLRAHSSVCTFFASSLPFRFKILSQILRKVPLGPCSSRYSGLLDPAGIWKPPPRLFPLPPPLLPLHPPAINPSALPHTSLLLLCSPSPSPPPPSLTYVTSPLLLDPPSSHDLLQRSLGGHV